MWCFPLIKGRVDVMLPFDKGRVRYILQNIDGRLEVIKQNLSLFLNPPLSSLVIKGGGLERVPLSSREED